MNKVLNKEVDSHMHYKTPAAPTLKTRNVNRQKGRRVPTLDATLGFALLKDRRVDRAQKLRALLMGGAAVAGVIGLVAVIAAILGVPGAALNPVVDGFGLLSGTLLIGSLTVMRLAPLDVISRVRCERYRVIPLRRRNLPVGGHTKQAPVDPLTALGYSQSAVVREYAVIPCRER